MRTVVRRDRARAADRFPDCARTSFPAVPKHFRAVSKVIAQSRHIASMNSSRKASETGRNPLRNTCVFISEEDLEMLRIKALTMSALLAAAIASLAPQSASARPWGWHGGWHRGWGWGAA